jgi:hypothetical protein
MIDVMKQLKHSDRLIENIITMENHQKRLREARAAKSSKETFSRQRQ